MLLVQRSEHCTVSAVDNTVKPRYNEVESVTKMLSLCPMFVIGIYSLYANSG